jgi:hypothetical protein
MKKSVPWGRSLLLGILGALALGACTPAWMLAQMGGPVPFGYVWIIVGGAALLLALFVVKTRTIISAVICGLVFSTPIAALCWMLSTMDPRLDYLKEMKGEGIATVIGSVILMILATFQRQISQPDLVDRDVKTKNTAPNRIHKAPSDKEGVEKEPPSGI